VDLKVAGVPRSDPAPAGKVWPAAKRVKELTSRRTEKVSYFQLSDGRTQAEISQTPVNYRDSKGGWQPIDLTVRPQSSAGFTQANTTNAFQTRFGQRSDRLVRFAAGGRWIELGLSGDPVDLTPVAKGSTVTYPAAASGADIVYEVTPTTLQEDLVLAKAPASAFSVTLSLKTTGLRARQTAQGAIEFAGRDDGRAYFVMPAPYMFDAKDDPKSDVGKTLSRKVAQTLTQSGSTAQITITPDPAWLADPARAYPVTIDPTVKIQPVPADGQDVEIYSGSVNTNYNNTYQLKVGTESVNTWRSLVKFPLTGIPAGTPIDDAQLQLFYSQTHWDWSYDVALEARRATAPWTESTATWANMNANMAAQPAGNMVTLDDGSTGTSFTGAWPYSTNPTLSPKAINGDYRFNNDATAGDTHTWTPTLTEAGDYQVEVHFTAESDRSAATPYTVFYNGGSKAYTVDQTGSPDGIWKTLGVHPFAAGTVGRVVVKDVAGKSVISDAVRFTKWGAATKKRAISGVWSSFAVRNVVQEWVNGTQPNHGFMVKAVDENDKGRGGPIYEASEYAYDNARRDYNLPKLVVTFGRPAVAVNAPTMIASTGAALTWPAYTDPSGSSADTIVEYQVHRSVFQTFTPSAATLVAPVPAASLSYQDTTAVPTPTDETDPLKRHFYYYMVAVKTADGQVIAGPTQGVLLPKAGQVTKVFRETSGNQVPDTTLAAGTPNTNVNVYDGDPAVSAGNNSSLYGDSRGVVKFANLAGVPTGAKVVDARLQMWATNVHPGTTTDGVYEVHKLTRGFDETTATWNKANATTSWTTPGGDFDPAVEDTVTGVTNDPEWQDWIVTNTVTSWLATPSSNFGFLLKLRDEVASNQRAILLSSEAAEPMLRPTLQVTYLEPTPESTYYAPATPRSSAPGDTAPVTVSVSNPTAANWSAGTWELSYHWALPDGTDVTSAGNQVATALPRDIGPGATADVTATVKAPVSAEGNKRIDYTLKWELHNKTTGQWLSATDGIAPLAQPVAVEEPTSDQLGLEHFYSYAGTNTGAGSNLMNNLYSGNTVWSYNALTNPSRGLATFVRMSYNSQDTSDTVAGFGWSLQTSSMMRLGTPLDFHPNPNPTTVKLTDGDGTTHTFSWDAAAGEWKSPKGVHLFLQQFVSCTPQTEEARAWSLTRPDRTQFFYDCDGYLSSIEDNNGNTMSFTYEVRKSQNKPTKFLRYITDATGRQTLTIDYWAKGDTYDYIDDNTWTKVTGQTNLTNPKIIDHIRTITDISGRKLAYTYTVKGLVGELIDGVGTTQPKTFKFQYDMTQGNKNVKLVKVTDPRGNATSLDYYSRPEDDPQFKWRLKAITDRLGFATSVAYTDPDGPQGATIDTTVTDANNRATAYKMDGFGRPVQTTNALQQTTALVWDGDHNVQQLTEANGAVSTWRYDPKTGYPTEIKDAEAVVNGWPGTTLAYQTGMNGHVADLIAKQSPEGRRWTFGYNTEGDLTSVTDPIGNTTADPDDYTTRYGYDTFGQLLTATDANGNTTRNSLFDDNGFPRTITDPLANTTQFAYDQRGNVTTVTDALLHHTTQTYDTFGRPLENRVPVDEAAGRFAITPAPQYDANDNILKSFTATGAVTTAVYDNADRLTSTLAALDHPTDPPRKTSYTYDKVGNLLSTTEPNGNLTASDPTDYVTTNAYDAIYQLTSITNTLGHKLSYEYDNVGNVITVIDPRKNATADTTDYTTKLAYDRAHRPTQATDALAYTTSTGYDKDGLAVSATDQLGNTTLTTLNGRGQPTEVKVPHVNNGGTIVYRITRYDYDQVGNQIKTTSPRGADTADANDFAAATVYDQLNRIKETRSPFDPADARYNTPDSTTYTYDKLSRLKTLSAPPSSGQSIRNDTSYTYFDNGWTRTSTDPFDILTTYNYNDLGQQTQRTLTSAGGSSDRTITWKYYLDGKLAARADDGVPVGEQVVLVDNSDTHNVAVTGTWPAASTAANKYGPDYASHPAGTGTNTFTWKLNIPQAGTYQAFARFPTVSGAATNAKYTVAHAGGSTVATVNQTQAAGTWVSLGSFAFAEGNTHSISLSDQAGGTVVADAVKLVRPRDGQTDAEKHDYTYTYDPNGNLTTIADASPGARVDTYAVSYNGINQIQQVQEKLGTTLKNTTAFTYNQNGAPLTVTHDKQYSEYTYGVRDLVATVKVGTSATDPNPKTTTYGYTARKQIFNETKANGNRIDYTHFLDGLLKIQTEKKSDATTLVSRHTLDYDLNGNRTRDVASTMNADNHAAYLNTTTDYTYDPRDRIVSKTATGDGAGTETYIHDANNNVTQQTIKNTTTVFGYDRNRLTTSTTAGAASTYNYDPFGRLDTITSGGMVIERNIYDGFDHILENRKTTSGTTATTRYAYDPLDRTASKTTDVGTPKQKTTNFTYLGLSGEVLDEEDITGTLTKSYQYSPWGERLSQTTHHADGTKEDAYYGYNPHTDVEQITNQGGDTKATYGYTAYGNNDDTQFTGIDKPDAADPTKEPYNVYRFNAKRFDSNSGIYDMGFRNYSPGLNRFVTRDTYNGSLADLNLGVNPFTGNRYTFAGGNPITTIEVDGHIPCAGAITCSGTGEASQSSSGCTSATACDHTITTQPRPDRCATGAACDPPCDINCVMQQSAPLPQGMTPNQLFTNPGFDYTGSKYYTYEDALMWASTSEAGFMFVCLNSLGGTDDGCKANNPYTHPNPNLRYPHTFGACLSGSVMSGGLLSSVRGGGSISVCVGIDSGGVGAWFSRGRSDGPMVGYSGGIQIIASDWNIQDQAELSQTTEFAAGPFGGSYAHGVTNHHHVDTIQFGWWSIGPQIGAAKSSGKTYVAYWGPGLGPVTVMPPESLQGNWPYLMGLPGFPKP